MRRFVRLLRFARPHAGAFAITFGAAVLASGLDGLSFALLIPFLRLLFGAGAGLAEDATVVERLLHEALGAFIDVDAGAALRNVVLLIIVAIALKNVFVYGAGAKGAFLQEAVARDLRCTLYRHIQQLGLGFYHRMKGGHLISRMVADVDQARLAVSAALVSAVQNAIIVVVYLAILFVLSWQLALLTLLLAPAIAVFMRPLLLHLRVRMKDALEHRGEMTSIVGETLEGARLVKAHGAEDYERRRFEASASAYFRQVVGARRLAVLAHPVSETLGAVVILLVLMMGMALAADSGTPIRPELFITFVAVTIRLLPPVKSLSQFPAHVEQSLAAAERVFEVLDLVPDEIDPPEARPFPGLHHSVEFRHVWVSYEPDTWVLRDVSLRVHTGEVVAIVGPSGVGKSTLVDMLPRFVEPQRGEVLVDGVPLNLYSRRSLRQAMGIVSQHTVLFHDTVRANIAYGDQELATAEAIEAAARAANAHEFIAQLPAGYDTVLGERGMTLSGGERQRIAIARALLRDPPILILDEATSALDPESERLVQEAMDRLLENRTVFVIAHRFSTVARADHIVVLDQGRVVERGRHDQLISAGGVYQRLHALELAAIAR